MWSSFLRRLKIMMVGAATVFVLATPASASAPQSEKHDRNAVYLALGDSLAAGVGASDWQYRADTRLGYVPRFAHRLQGAGIRQVVNVARPGETSASFFASGQWVDVTNTIADPTTNVTVVTLDIGGNDLLKLLSPSGPCSPSPRTEACAAAVADAINDFAPQYAKLLSDLRLALAAEDAEPERLLVMTYFNPFSGTGNAELEPVVDEAVRAMNQVIVGIGQAYGATIVDAYPVFVGKGPALTHISTGDVHPNNAGYAHLAAAFMKAWR